MVVEFSWGCWQAVVACKRDGGGYSAGSDSGGDVGARGRRRKVAAAVVVAFVSG
ncbi:hypothetical protein Hdeb2414_s0019g00548471 [Helianthus debilis subsp. tardiflorus]